MRQTGQRQVACRFRASKRSGSLPFSIYQSNGDLPALINAIALFREAVAAAPDCDAGRAACWSNLGASLWMLFERTGDMEALTGAIRVMREAVAAAPDGHPDRAMRMNNLGNALQAMSGRTGDADALTEAIQVTTAADAAAPHGHPNRAVNLIRSRGRPLDAVSNVPGTRRCWRRLSGSWGRPWVRPPMATLTAPCA